MKIGGATIPEAKSPSSSLNLHVRSGHPAMKLGIGKSAKFIVRGTVKDVSKAGHVSLELTKHSMVGKQGGAGHMSGRNDGYRASGTFGPTNGTRMPQQDRTVNPNDGQNVPEPR